MTTFVDVHVLQSVPPSCINRDDTGSPKTAVYGGVRRARVSSQAWKRATRKDFENTLNIAELGVRTLRVVELVTDKLKNSRVESDDALALAQAVVEATGLKLSKNSKPGKPVTNYLVLVSQQQASTLADLAASALQDAGGDVKTAVESIGKNKKGAKAALDGTNSIDLALFGRMVADDTDLNVDAACQVAHAISVHASETEFDYFTAVDDLKGGQSDDDEPADAGAGMIGTVEFTSSTLYRYATINVDELVESLGDRDMADRAISAFIRSFTRSMPTGKANTFANHTLPDAIVVTIRDDHPLSLVGGFESPVLAKGSGGFMAPAAEAMRAQAEALDKAYGSSLSNGGERPVWTIGVGAAASALTGWGTPMSFAELPEAAAAAAVGMVAEAAAS
ncbi:type I-E CRISPR-associated protein Cas7/Cse4/CasC [Nakamurella aerolata]|uniref:Type I-E CRISPR-associated protein Cas7/Cse4/CasC n=1 Tax=Nakamurella aerolata TaxID=1656892 RepID=A0A849A711_9ACTN|nr:type I-E CRISPR-associated protein Cas7/Cse4/CasC [Nakamurella aerolata]NNG35426.1 type I-E CRISPR-associated protein Cas7/Cse4/CasC [Nakamurella aerolata]